MAASYFKYWGKVQKSPEQQDPSYLLLPYHCLDVAAVGQVLLKQNQPYQDLSSSPISPDANLQHQDLTSFDFVHTFHPVLSQTDSRSALNSV